MPNIDNISPMLRRVPQAFWTPKQALRTGRLLLPVEVPSSPTNKFTPQAVQTRNVRVNPMRYKLRNTLTSSSVEAVVEPTPPKLHQTRSFFDLKRWALHVFWNVRSWWESMDPRLSLQSMKKDANELYVEFRDCEAQGDLSPVSSKCNLTFFRESKKKIESQNRKGVEVTWNHDEPKAKIASMRFVKYPGSTIRILQVGVQIRCKQGVTISKGDKVIKEVPKKTTNELLVMETSMNEKKGKIHWRILDILDSEGYGVLPRGATQTYLEEQ